MILKDWIKKAIGNVKRITTNKEKLNTYAISFDLRLNEKAEVSDKGNQIVRLNSIMIENEHDKDTN